MLELPEARIISEQLSLVVGGKEITDVIVNYSPHKFAWYHEDPADYPALLIGKKIDGAHANGGQVEVCAGDARMVFTDGVNLRYIERGGKLPAKHQLLIGFDDDSCIVATVQMYGGLWCFKAGTLEHPYYQVARNKPNVFSDEFSERYFLDMSDREDMQKKSLKALLATEQSIPGLGNGVLQDILYNVSLHPRRKTATLTEAEKLLLFKSIKTTLQEMYEQKGRDTEKDLLGCPGRYITQLSRKTLGTTCLKCGGMILKDNYLGGTVYYCNGCQKENP